VIRHIDAIEARLGVKLFQRHARGYTPTEAGRATLGDWLDAPVTHVRQLRVEFLAKLRLLERRGRSPGPLVRAQRRALDATIDGLTAAGDGDVVDRWRAHNAAAVDRFLADLA
jgi:PadR family transcriptional regulator AphA